MIIDIPKEVRKDLFFLPNFIFFYNTIYEKKISKAGRCIFRKNCASVPEERSAIPLQTEQSSSSDSDLKKYDGMRVEKVIKELTEKDYDRELLDDTDRNEDGKRRYEINCMYEVKLQNGEIINAYEDEINPNYCGDYEA